jgi:hypothetical protein
MQNDLDKDEYFPLTKTEGFKIFAILVVFAVIWAGLMVVLPLSVIIAYFAFMVAILAALWMSPRIVDVGVEDNGNFVKVNK